MVDAAVVWYVHLKILKIQIIKIFDPVYYQTNIFTNLCRVKMNFDLQYISQTPLKNNLLA